ncbi:TetR/AcrR family transcriptional regulator, partial [Streptomyces eurythermus]
MARRNDQRRAALVDAAIEVLARDGARGLTFRAVDTEAAVPVGTASNYFADRDDLLTQAGARVYERLRPDEATVRRQRAAGRDRETYAELMRELVGRVAAFRTGYLALLELRLEATRRPGLRDVLTERVRADMDANVAYHESAAGRGGGSAQA